MTPLSYPSLLSILIFITTSLIAPYSHLLPSHDLRLWINLTKETLSFYICLCPSYCYSVSTYYTSLTSSPSLWMVEICPLLVTPQIWVDDIVLRFHPLSLICIGWDTVVTIEGFYTQEVFNRLLFNFGFSLNTIEILCFPSLTPYRLVLDSLTVTRWKIYCTNKRFIEEIWYVYTKYI